MNDAPSLIGLIIGLGTLLWLPAVALCHFLIALTVSTDAQKRGLSFGAWFIGVLLTGPYAVLAYIAVRPERGVSAPPRIEGA